MNKYWTISFWILLAGWATGAALVMARVRGGFFTNYLSDLTFPAWCYIYFRGLWRKDGRLPRLALAGDWFGITPERASISIMLFGIVTEVMTFLWPSGIITATFDPFDILAYAVGIFVCYYFDKREQAKVL